MSGETISTGTRTRIHQSDALNTGALQCNNTQAPNSVFTAEPQPEVNPVPATPVQNPADAAPTSSKFLGYNIFDLRKYLKKGTTDSSTFEQLKNEAEIKLNDSLLTYKESPFYSKENEQFLLEIFPGEDGLKKAIIEAYFNVDEAFNIANNIKNSNGATKEDLHSLYNLRAYGCEVANLNIIDLNVNGSEKLKELIERLNTEEMDYEKKKETIEHYVLYLLCHDKDTDINEKADAIFTIITSTQDYDVKKIILDLITKYINENQIENTGNTSLQNIQTDLVIAVFESCSNPEEKREIASLATDPNLLLENKQLFKYIVSVLSDSSSPAYTDLSDEEKSILNRFFNNENLKPEEYASIEKIVGSLLEAFQNLKIVDEITGNDTPSINQVVDAINHYCSEEEKRDFWAGIYNKLEQNPAWFQGIDQTKIQEIMDRISNGHNSSEGSSSQGDGSSIPEGGYDQSSGGYYVNPSFNYETQSAYVFNLQQNIYTSSNQSQLPQRVVDNTPVAEETTTVSSNPSYINTIEEGKEYLRKNANGVKNFFTGKVDGINGFANMAIEKYKTFGKEQAGILAESKQKFFNKLQGLTKINSIESFFAAGGKGNSVDRTRAMQEMVDEDNEKKKKEEKMGC